MDKSCRKLPALFCLVCHIKYFFKESASFRVVVELEENEVVFGIVVCFVVGDSHY